MTIELNLLSYAPRDLEASWIGTHCLNRAKLSNQRTTRNRKVIKESSAQIMRIMQCDDWVESTISEVSTNTVTRVAYNSFIRSTDLKVVLET